MEKGFNSLLFLNTAIVLIKKRSCCIQKLFGHSATIPLLAIPCLIYQLVEESYIEITKNL